MKNCVPEKKTPISIIFILFVGVFLFFIGSFILEGVTAPYVKNEDFYFASVGNVALSEKPVSYTINKGDGNILVFTVKDLKTRETVYSLLKKLSQEKNFEEKTLEYDIGVFVEMIDGYKNGENNKYWQYWVNGRLGDVAADKKIVESGDAVEWRFEVPLEF